MEGAAETPVFPSTVPDLAATSALADPSTANSVAPDPIPASGGEESPRQASTRETARSMDEATVRKRGRPKGSKNKPKPQEWHLVAADPPVKRPIGRPRGSGKKSAEPASPESPKRPRGRPRKDGLPPGTSSSKLSTLVPPPSDNPNSNAIPPINQWVPFPGSISAPPGPAPPPPAPVVDPVLQRNEWAELAHSKPHDFLHVLLTALSTIDAAPSGMAGLSVEDAFKSHLGSLAPPPTSSASSSAGGSAPSPQPQTIPSLYSLLKTFWLPSSPNYFALTASSNKNNTTHRFFYWDPQPLVFNGIACPSCGSPLSNRGRIRSGPLTVYDLTSPFYIIGCAYVCANNHVHASTDASVRRALPAALEREFPARLLDGDTGVAPDVWNWQVRGVSRALWNLVQGALHAGLAPDVILRLVRDVQHGVPEPVPMKEEEPPAPAAQMEEEEESAEEAAEGQREAADVVMAPPTESAADSSAASVALAPPAGAVNTWTANFASTSGDMSGNPYARLAFTLPIFAQTNPNPTVGNSWDLMNRKRSYPFGPSDGSGAGPEDGGGSSSSTEPPVKTRNPRHCCKCGSAACKGKGGRNFCTSACMDCGKLTCRGRNSRRPDKRCDVGWPEEQTPVQIPVQPLDGSVV
ncbi:hypothetical protein B0H16DRAFT_1556757 [Mycena metata]|uniref:Uncharacterized protein n=1 Tax=Mycena metata TaxID=1033252 RepID=A0AAD7INK5_9AGAR|nr:hypothetical protein B0H16DRAFT_1556757 [Mycena metata]